MAQPQKFFLLVPTFNVADRVIGVLDAIPKDIWEKLAGVFIIDNGSKDGTREILQNWGRRRADPKLQIFFNEKNYSLGGSTIIAMREAMKANGDFLICLHSDGQADPRALQQFLDFSQPDVDLVLGNRLSNAELSREYSVVRRLGNLFFEKLQDRIMGQKLGDIGAFISFNLHTMAEIPYWALPHDMGHQPMLILTAARRKKLNIVEFPIFWGKADKTNINPVRYGMVHLWRIFCLALNCPPKTAKKLKDFATIEVVLSQR